MDGQSKFLTPKEASAYLGIQEKTLANWRSMGRPPIYRKFSRCVRYAVSDLQQFADDATRRSTSDPGHVCECHGGCAR